MAEPEKKRRFSNIFKTKESNAKVSGSQGTTVTMAEGTGSGSPGEDGPRGGRRKLFTQLSESEKSMRRSTLGSAQLSQATQAPQPPPPAASGQIAAASTNSKGVLFSRPTTANAANPELETPFAKMVRTTGSGAAAAGPTTGAKPSNQDTSSTDSAAASGARRGSNVQLTAEEKKTRRKSLLAPVQNLFSGLGSGNEGQSSTGGSTGELTFSDSAGGTGASNTSSGGLSSSNASLDGKDKKKKSLFGKGREKGLDFQTGLQLDDSQAKLQKERQKKLQKELDKIEKEKAKQEKARQTRLLDVLQQTLELGEERAQIPMPSHRSAFALPMRPPAEVA